MDRIGENVCCEGARELDHVSETTCCFEAEGLCDSIG